MAYYSFTMPVLTGKTEDLKKYLQEMTGPRMRDFDRFCQRIGLRSEQMWIQRMPEGFGKDMLIVLWDTDDPMRIFQQGFDLQNSFDKWFLDKILIECVGMDPESMDKNQIQPLNEHIVNFTAQAIGEKKHVEAGKR